MYKTQKSHNGTKNYITLKCEVSQLHNIVIFKKITLIYKLLKKYKNISFKIRQFICFFKIN